MEELKVLPREVQTISYELRAPRARSLVDEKKALVGSKKKLNTACAGLDVLNQRVMRGLNPEVRTKMTGRLYTGELNDVERGAFDRVLRDGEKWR